MTWNASQRDALLSEIKQLNEKRKGPGKSGIPIEQRQEMYQREMRLIEEYAENVPYHAFSRCPFCETLAEMPMDTQGLDGIWWWEQSPVDFAPPEACEHYQVFLGALNLHDRTPVEITDGVAPGPGVPFVIRRLLEFDSVKAVLGSFKLETGDTAYIVTYFSEEPLDDVDLHQEWRQEFYPLLNEDGEPVATETKLDEWDFDLDKWVENGKLFWTDAGDDSFTLHSGLPFPYSNLAGVRDSQILSQDGIFLKPAPVGGDSALYERL